MAVFRAISYTILLIVMLFYFAADRKQWGPAHLTPEVKSKLQQQRGGHHEVSVHNVNLPR